jgi:hypothetical protein
MNEQQFRLLYEALCWHNCMLLGIFLAVCALVGTNCPKK